MRLLVAIAAALSAACHPLACFHPADLPRDPPLLLESKADFPKEDVEVLVDDLGIPHIFGNSEPDLAYALGVMHGRDRQFQIYLFKHAGEGRLTEILGEDLLPIDRQNRLLLHRAQELLDALEPRDKDVVDAYCAGVNEGAAMVGKSAEMNVLGVEWEPFVPLDVLAIVRLQQWDQSVGFAEELVRWRLAKALGATEPAVLAEILQDVPSKGVPIVAADEHDGEAFTPPAAPAGFHAPPRTAAARPPPARVPTAASALKQKLADDLAETFGRGGRGASNSWSIHGSLTASGAPMLANDPHLSHSAPGVFYMAHLEAPDFTIVGGTFPGIPGVLIGHGRDVAWGITNAFADTQDLVHLKMREGDPDSYVVDGDTYAFGKVRQVFKLGKEEDAKVVEETLLTTIFGPVLPEEWGSYGGATPVIDKDEKLALQWTAAEFPADSAKLMSGFWDLAKSKTPEEATAAIQNFASPAMSMNLAFTNGDIAYRLSGIVPIRDEQRVDFPRDGSRSSSKWSGRVPAAQKPQATSPAKGYIVASNQRVVDNDVVSQAFVGFEGSRPWRALRIDQRIKELLENGEPTADEVLAIQQDVVGLDAVDLAPIYGAHCPEEVEGHDKARVAEFCDTVATFDGAYTVDSHALAFARLHREFQLVTYEAHMEPDLAEDLVEEGFAVMALYELILREHAGEGAAALFDDPRTADREGLDGMVARATKRALDILVEETGGAKGDWRWGKLHQLSLRGALASAPVIGFLFQTSAREESGTSSAPRAENASAGNKMAVRGGAALRLIAEMTQPPTVRLINDSGQSGHFGHRHLEDQYPLWTKGEPRVMWMTQAQVKEKLDGAMVIKPRR